MKLTKQQIELVTQEAGIYLVFDENYKMFSKKLWNKYRIDATIEFRNGEFYKAVKF